MPPEALDLREGWVVQDNNGETIVIGGIITEDQSHGNQNVPWLSEMPVLGWLFKSN